jgi:hypothetical protein
MRGQEANFMCRKIQTTRFLTALAIPSGSLCIALNLAVTIGGRKAVSLMLMESLKLGMTSEPLKDRAGHQTQSVALWNFTGSANLSGINRSWKLR